MLRIAHRQTAPCQQAGPVGFLINGNRTLRAGFRRHHHQAVAKQGGAGRRIDGLFVSRVVHPLLIGGDKQIRRGACFNLPRQRRRRGKRRDDLDVFSFLYAWAISCIALVNDAAAKTVTFPSAASA